MALKVDLARGTKVAITSGGGWVEGELAKDHPQGSIMVHIDSDPFPYQLAAPGAPGNRLYVLASDPSL